MQFGSQQMNSMVALTGAPVEQIYHKVVAVAQETQELFAITAGMWLTLVPFNPVNWVCSFVVSLLASVAMPGHLTGATEARMQQNAMMLSLICNSKLVYMLMS